MTPAQIKLIHIAKRQLELDEWGYREILKKIGRVDSSTKLSNAGFERVMAFFEGRGFNDTTKAPTYWRDKAAARDRLASSNQVFLIRQLAPLVHRYPLDVICRRFSNNRTTFPEQLNPIEARQLIEMLKAVEKRNNEAGNAKDVSPVGKDVAQGCVAKEGQQNSPVEAG